MQENFSSIEDVLPCTDVLYMTRIQRERFSSVESYNKVVRSIQLLYCLYSSITTIIICSLVFT